MSLTGRFELFVELDVDFGHELVVKFFNVLCVAARMRQLEIE